MPQYVKYLYMVKFTIMYLVILVLCNLTTPKLCSMITQLNNIKVITMNIVINIWHT